jgi:predicted O-linked N-acetylglucosamine transferase (SPINDLY family)
MRRLTADFQSLCEHPFVLLAYPEVSPEEQKQVAGQYVKRNIPLSVLNASDPEWPIRGVSQQEKNRLRIGYLSSDFKNHPVGLIIPEVIELHNRDDFEVFGYSFGFDDHSDVRQRLEKSFDHFADLAEASVGETAHRIRNDCIDILIDLNGWTMDGRPEALALRCAPIQVNWLGYAGTMGHGKLADYLLGDPVVTPLIAEGAYAETLAQLPDCYLPVDTTIDPGMPPTRRNAGLPDTGFVFCSFNNSYKFNPYVFDTWCRLLREAPDSCLWLSLPGQSAQDNLRKEAAARGVDPGRIFFAPFVATKQEHLARIQLADLALDTFPYNSHSSGVDTLWAGVPMVALLGETFPGRVGASLLRAAGLDEMVTVSIDQYHDLALEMYQNPQRLRDMRAKLAQAKKQSPLFDMPAFVRGLERVYLRMQNDRLTGIRAPII